MNEREILDECRKTLLWKRLHHSCSHIMVPTIPGIWPDAPFAYGPAIENDFHDDFDRKHQITPKEFEEIETETRKTARDNPKAEYKAISGQETIPMAESNRHGGLTGPLGDKARSGICQKRAAPGIPMVNMRRQLLARVNPWKMRQTQQPAPITPLTSWDKVGRTATLPEVRSPFPAFFLLAILNTFLSAQPIKLSPLVVEARKDEPSTSTGGTAALATTTPLEPNGEKLSDLFQQIPGLITQDSFGGFDPPRISIRGSGIQSAPTSRGIAISFFGMPLNSADGSFNLALLENSWLESATLIRGPAAGVTALGGSLILGSPMDAFAPGKSITALYGSDETTTLSARGSHGTRDHAIAGMAAFNQTNGWRPHSQQERESVLATARTSLADDWDLTIQFYGSHPYYEVPGPLTEHAALNHPTSPVPSVMHDDPRRESEYARLSTLTTRRWSDARVSLGIGAVRNRDDFYQLQANGVSTTDATETYIQFNAQKDWNLAGQHTGFSSLLQTGWWDAFRYRNNKGEKGALIGNQRLLPLTMTNSLDHRVDLTASQHLEIGVSALTAQRDIDDRFHPGPGASAVDLTLSGTRFAPRVAWSWSAFDETTFVLSYARSYEPPTFNDLLFTTGPLAARVMASKPLDWQRADSLEIAAHGTHDRFSWSSAIHAAAWQGEFLRLANEDGSTRGTVNADHTLHSGWENTIEWKLSADSLTDLTLWATYNYTDARFDDDAVYDDHRLAGVPPHTGAVGLRAVSPGGWFIAPGCQWRAGETYADHAHHLGYGGSTLWSLELGLHHPDGWSASLGIHNIFDSKTIASTSGVLDSATNPQNTAIFLPAAGRTLELRFQYRW